MHEGKTQGLGGAEFPYPPWVRHPPSTSVCLPTKKFLKMCHCEHFAFCFVCVLPYCVSCRTLAPGPGIKPMPPAMEAWGLNHWTSWEVLIMEFLLRSLYIGTVDLIIGHWWLNSIFSCSSLPKGWVIRLEVYPSNHMVGFPCYQPHPEAI